ncbi:MAG: TetR/AcrR family transcriptional regulator, partial [Acidimicrobiales bacterium]
MPAATEHSEEMDKRAGGRPRSPEIDDAVMRATRDLLVERGYGGLSVEGVANRAEVGKAAIYRRWPSKAELVVEALRTYTCAGLPTTQAGDLRTDLLALLTVVQQSMAERDGPLMATFIAAKARFPDLQAEFDRAFVAERRAYVQQLIRDGVRRGELPANTDVELLAETGPAILSHHY